MFKKTTKIYKRLRNLSSKLQRLRFTDTSSEDLYIRYESSFIDVFIDTKLGKRCFELSTRDYGYKIWYLDETTVFDIVFQMKVSKTQTLVEPQLIKLKAKDIDLAILEIEERVERLIKLNVLNDAEHNRQIKLLEN